MSEEVWTAPMLKLHQVFWEWRFQEASVKDVLPAAEAAVREGYRSRSLVKLATALGKNGELDSWRRSSAERLLLEVAREYGFLSTDEQSMRRDIVHRSITEMALPGSPARALAQRVHFVGQAFLPDPEDTELARFILPDEDWDTSEEGREVQAALRDEARDWPQRHPRAST